MRRKKHFSILNLLIIILSIILAISIIITIADTAASKMPDGMLKAEKSFNQ